MILLLPCHAVRIKRSLVNKTSLRFPSRRLLRSDRLHYRSVRQYSVQAHARLIPILLERDFEGIPFNQKKSGHAYKGIEPLENPNTFTISKARSLPRRRPWVRLNTPDFLRHTPAFAGSCLCSLFFRYFARLGVCRVLAYRTTF